MSRAVLPTDVRKRMNYNFTDRVRKVLAMAREEAIRLHCRARLESGLLPRFIEIRESLPRSVNGKVRKSELATTFTYST